MKLQEKISKKKINFYYDKWVKKIGWAYNVNPSNTIDENFKNYKDISDNHGVVFTPKNNIGDLYVDSTLFQSDLCKIGKKYETDKSPHNLVKHRHPYTAVYDLIFSPYRRKKINICEIGIFYNSSIKMWREYFQEALIFGFDSKPHLIKKAQKDNLENVFYLLMDVKKTDSIQNNFDKLNKLGINFDIIIDDSTHSFEDQIRIIKNSTKYINTGGILVIEDIPKSNPDFAKEKFQNELKEFLKYFDSLRFVNCDNINKFSSTYNNDRLLILTRNNIRF